MKPKNLILGINKLGRLIVEHRQKQVVFNKTIGILLLVILVVTFADLSCRRKACLPRKPDLLCPIQFYFEDFICTDTIRVYKSRNCEDCSEFCKAGFDDDCFKSLLNYIKERTKEETEPILVFFISKGYVSEVKRFNVNDVLALGHYHYIPESRELILRIFFRDTLSNNYIEAKELSGNVSGLNTMNPRLIADDFYSEIPKKTIMNISRYQKSTNPLRIDVSLKFKNDKFFERFSNFIKKYKKQN